MLKESSVPLPSTVTKSAIKPYLRQQPNKKIFGARFHLGLYNLSNIEKSKWPHGWLRRIGEEPVVFDPVSRREISRTDRELPVVKGVLQCHRSRIR
ncbi:MAG: hypothetical protein MZV63_27520 [Marinilabiliales bacterium]|nr:hypothetical protein [Marinilabiliales bacterium]